MAEFSQDSRFSARIRDELQRQLRSENLPPSFMQNVTEYVGLNLPSITSGQIVGSQRYTRQIDATATALDINTTASETTVYTTSLGGGTLGTQGAVKLLLTGDYLNNSGAARGLQLRVKYGATTMFDDTTSATAFSADADRRPWRLELELSGADATNAQNMSGLWTISANAFTLAAGIGAASTTNEVVSAIGGTAAEDSTLNKDITVTIQHSASHGSLSFRRKYALLTQIGH